MAARQAIRLVLRHESPRATMEDDHEHGQIESLAGRHRPPRVRDLGIARLPVTEEEKTIRAALTWRNHGLGTPILIGREERVRETMASMGIEVPDGIEIHNARLSARNADYAEFLYRRNQRRGLLPRDCQRQVSAHMSSISCWAYQPSSAWARVGSA